MSAGRPFLSLPTHREVEGVIGWTASPIYVTVHLVPVLIALIFATGLAHLAAYKERARSWALGMASAQKRTSNTNCSAFLRPK